VQLAFFGREIVPAVRMRRAPSVGQPVGLHVVVEQRLGRAVPQQHVSQSLGHLARVHAASGHGLLETRFQLLHDLLADPLKVADQFLLLVIVVRQPFRDVQQPRPDRPGDVAADRPDQQRRQRRHQFLCQLSRQLHTRPPRRKQARAPNQL